MAALQLTCAYELFQVWNMATTETQLMLSVGLIGKFRLGSRSFVFFFKRSRRLRSAEHAGQSHDTIVIRECPLTGLLLLHVQPEWPWMGS